MDIFSKALLIIAAIVSTATFAQQRDTLHGRVVSGNRPVFDVYIINKATGTETKSGRDGNFVLPAKPGDALVVYSDKTELREFAIREESMKENPYVIAVNYKGYELEEVVITDTITEQGLGLVPEGYKEYTPAERKLKTATDLDMRLSMGAAMSLDPLINAISGRTKKLKKALAVERKEMAIDKIYAMFTEQQLKGFNVPEEYIKGFLFYIIEDEGFNDAVKAENTDLVAFRMQVLAEEYTKRIKNE